MDKLTNEQLRELQENAETYTMVHSPAVLSAVAELLPLRAELEATNAAMDDEIASHQDTLRLWNALRAERAKLEAALRWTRDAILDPEIQDSGIVSRIDTALAQPAESGATEMVRAFNAWTPGAKP